MKELKLRNIWLTIGLGYIVAIFYLCLRKSASSTLSPFPHFDKLLHFSAYFLLMSYFVQVIKRASYKLIFIIFLLMGILIEFLQLIIGYRSFEFLDILANSAGLLAAWFLFGNHLSNILLWFEKKLYFKNT